MKKLIISMLLLASTQANALTESDCKVITQEHAYQYVAVNYCHAPRARYDELLDLIDNSDCNRFADETRVSWVLSVVMRIDKGIDNAGLNKVCDGIVKIYLTD